MKSRFDPGFGGSVFSILVIFCSQSTTQNLKKRHSTIASVLLAKKNRFDLVFGGSLFSIFVIFCSQITNQNGKKSNSAITRVLLEKKSI